MIASKAVKILWLAMYIMVNGFLTKAQNFTIEGKVTDSLGVPIPFVSIGLVESPQGTFTNEDGEFLINLTEKKQITLLISHVAFKKATIAVVDFNKKIEIKLLHSQKILPEVKVSLLGLHSMKKAFEKIIKSEKKYSSQGFYRQVTTEDNEITNFMECYYSMNMNTISNIDKYTIQNGRYGTIKRELPNFTYNVYNFKHYPLGFSNAKKSIPDLNRIIFPMFPDLGDFYTFSVVEVLKDNDSEILKIQCNPSSKLSVAFRGYYYLNRETLNIERIEGEVVGELGLSFSNIENNFESRNRGFSIVASYKQIGNYSIPQYLNMKARVLVSLKGSDKKINVSGTLYYFDYSDKTNKRGKKNSIKTHDFKEVVKSKYDQNFWKQNSPIKHTSNEDKAIEIYDKNKYFGTYFNE